ncbi:Fe(3+) dicitrate transport ATP-binding protein FecE [Fundidesulfovibrio magnetotacticus]|uniref:Fe(3+) dicitrate transport ATP-binding protein FecE n=1 Tax=Fundidesulfovibrio magnetotacticus TaxID=2730080 RepID=A0A6V8LY45_9BACT|nr:ABC transporter ATP-binding protein [Fundidesulfovibrio magnetotacticus]GFK94736.1 Fe(3+) dicitrate transport ATP-binding protein FecE [Fundidesulfovibrio magnetotacticus]
MLEAKGLRVNRGGRLESVDLRLAPGDFLAVVGPNGAGKSTLLRALAGLVRPCGGEALLDGRAVSGLPRREAARQVAYCPQHEDGRFGFTVLESALLGRHPWTGRFGDPGAGDLALARAVLEETDLTHLADRSVTELSGGERRRASLARTLAQAGASPRSGGARALLLDEPTAGLDIRHAFLAMAALRRRVQAGAAVAVVLHDLNLAAMYCPLTLALDAGRVAAYGPTSRVLEPGLVARVFGVRCRVSDGHILYLEDR